jgi:hypothetical protein
MPFPFLFQFSVCSRSDFAHLTARACSFFTFNVLSVFAVNTSFFLHICTDSPPTLFLLQVPYLSPMLYSQNLRFLLL